jgi:hypothetical protein
VGVATTAAEGPAIDDEAGGRSPLDCPQAASRNGATTSNSFTSRSVRRHGIAFEGPWPEHRPVEFTLVDPTTCSVLDRLALNAGRPHLIVVTNGRFENRGEIDLSRYPPTATRFREVPECAPASIPPLPVQQPAQGTRLKASGHQ